MGDAHDAGHYLDEPADNPVAVIRTARRSGSGRRAARGGSEPTRAQRAGEAVGEPARPAGRAGHGPPSDRNARHPRGRRDAGAGQQWLVVGTGVGAAALSGADVVRATSAAEHVESGAAGTDHDRRVGGSVVSSPTALPVAGADVVGAFESMASAVNVRLQGAAGRADHLVPAVTELFAEVEAQCTRFDPASPLMQANAAADDWFRVPARCYAAILAAEDAYRVTAGRFDPRVLDRKSTRLNSSHTIQSRMPSSA